MVTKKSGLIAIVVLFALASATSAALVPTIDGTVVNYGDIVVVGDLGLYSDTFIIYYDVSFIITSGDLAFDSSTITFPLLFELGREIVYEDAAELRVAASNILMPVDPGQLVDSIGLSGQGTIEIYDWDRDTTLGSINVVPEPGTGLLFAIGALALCVKRRWRQD